MLKDVMPLTPNQFRDWVRTVVIEEPLFEDRNQLATALAANADRAALEEPFRLFFEAYWELAFTLGLPEASLLALLETCNAVARHFQTHSEIPVLKHRLKAVELKRKLSPIGRKVRQIGGDIAVNDPQPAIKVQTLSDAAFRGLLDTLVNWPLFTARDRVVKVLNTKTNGYAGSTPLSSVLLHCLEAPCAQGEAISIASLQEQTGGLSVAAEMDLLSAFFAFLVCHLELELFFEDYDYDPDEGLELRPEILEQIDRDLAYIKAGGKTYSLEEVFEELELDS